MSSTIPHRPATLRVRLPGPAGEVTLEAHPSLAAAEHEWRAFEAGAQGHPYQCFDWLSAWHAHFGTAGLQPMVVMLRDAGGRTRMLLPLALERSLGMTRLVPMGAPVCDYHGPLVDAVFASGLDTQAMQQLLQAVMSLAGADYAVLTHVPPRVGTAPNPLGSLPLRPYSANAHAVSLGSGWNSFYAQHRGSKTLSGYRKKEKALARSGTLVFSEVIDGAERAALVDRVVALKGAQLERTAGTFNCFARADVQSFFRTLAADEQAHRVFAFKLTVGDALLAAMVGLMHNGCFYYEVPVYPEHPLQRYSPGGLLLMRVMDWAVERGCTRFDFTVGDEPYKAEWCNESWPLGCGAWPRTWRGQLGARIALARFAAERHVKQRPVLYAMAVRVRTAIGMARAWRRGRRTPDTDTGRFA